MGAEAHGNAEITIGGSVTVEDGQGIRAISEDSSIGTFAPEIHVGGDVSSAHDAAVEMDSNASVNIEGDAAGGDFAGKESRNMIRHMIPSLPTWKQRM